MRILSVLVLALFSFMAFGQEEVSAELQTMVNLLGPVLIGLIAKYPITATIIAFMGTARTVLKPLMSMVITLGASFPDVGFLKKLEGFAGSKIYKTIAFLLDYFASVKLPAEKK